MKSYRFGFKQLKAKPAQLSESIDAAIICGEFAKSDICANAGVSSVFAAKLLSALEECRFTYLKNERIGKPNRKTYTLSDTLSVLVIDLSMPRYSMSIIRGRSGCQFYKSYPYNPLLSLYENVFAFLSGEAKQIKKLSFGVAAICLIYADSKNRDLSAFASLSVHLPDEHDLEKIDSVIASVFGFLPILHLKNSQAIKKAIEYRKINGALQDTPTTYIYIGDSVSVVHLPTKGAPIICDTNNLLINDRSTVSSLFREAISSEDLGCILYRIFNFTHCAYSAGQYIIEYDSLKFDAIALKELKKAFVICGEALPEIVASSHIPGIAHFGAASMSYAEIIKEHVTAGTENT